MIDRKLTNCKNEVVSQSIAEQLLKDTWVENMHNRLKKHQGDYRIEREDTFRKYKQGGKTLTKKCNKFVTGGDMNPKWTGYNSTPYKSMYDFGTNTQEPLLTVPMYTSADGFTNTTVPQKDVEEALGYRRYVMSPEEIPSTDELQTMINKEVIFPKTKDDWKSAVNDNDTESMFNIIRDDTAKFKSKLNKISGSYWPLGRQRDRSDRLKITAPNTDISKFVFGNNISKDAISEIRRVSQLRGQDPYDILSHMLIEKSGSPIVTNEYYNTHDVVKRQLNSSLYDKYDSNDNILKQLGIYNKSRTPNTFVMRQAYDRIRNKREESFNNLIIPESTIDAVGLRMQLHGRDFNPAQKEYYSGHWGVKNSYLDMIDSAIGSLKENMPNLFTDNK